MRAQSHIRQYLKPILVKVAPSFFARRLRVGPKEKEPTQQAQALFHEAKALKVHSSPISPAPLSSLRRDSLCRAVQALTGKPIWALPPQEVRAEACRGGGAFSQPLLLVLPRSLVHQASLRPPPPPRLAAPLCASPASGAAPRLVLLPVSLCLHYTLLCRCSAAPPLSHCPPLLRSPLRSPLLFSHTATPNERFVCAEPWTEITMEMARETFLFDVDILVPIPSASPPPLPLCPMSAPSPCS